jgi:hypothetical protein
MTCLLFLSFVIKKIHVITSKVYYYYYFYEWRDPALPLKYFVFRMRPEVLRRTTNYARNSEIRTIIHRIIDIPVSCSVRPEFSFQNGLFCCPSFILQTLKSFKLNAVVFIHFQIRCSISSSHLQLAKEGKMK